MFDPLSVWAYFCWWRCFLQTQDFSFISILCRCEALLRMFEISRLFTWCCVRNHRFSGAEPRCYMVLGFRQFHAITVDFSPIVRRCRSLSWEIFAVDLPRLCHRFRSAIGGLGHTKSNGRDNHCFWVVLCLFPCGAYTFACICFGLTFVFAGFSSRKDFAVPMYVAWGL